MEKRQGNFAVSLGQPSFFKESSIAKSFLSVRVSLQPDGWTVEPTKSNAVGPCHFKNGLKGR